MSTPSCRGTEPRTTTQFVFGFTQGDKDQNDLLGGKGADLAERPDWVCPCRPGFTITTEACREYLALGTERAARARAGNDRPALDTTVRARTLGPPDA